MRSDCLLVVLARMADEQAHRDSVDALARTNGTFSSESGQSLGLGDRLV